MFYTFPDAQAIAEYTAELLIRQIKEKNNTVLGLATGSTMEPLYQELSTQVSTQNINLGDLSTFTLNEYVGLGADHAESYAHYMQEHLFNRLAFVAHRNFLPDGLSHDPEQQCANYSQQIEQAGSIDIQLLGIGKNGHIGFNEPGTPFTSRCHVVKLSEQTRQDNSRFFSSINAVPSHAITLGIHDIMQAAQIILIATGANKAEIIAELYDSEVNVNLPASILKTHQRARVFVDQEAAQLLPQEACRFKNS